MATGPGAAIGDRRSRESSPAWARGDLKKGENTIAETDDIVRLIVIVIVAIAPPAAAAVPGLAGDILASAGSAAARPVLVGPATVGCPRPILGRLGAIGSARRAA